MKTTRAIPVIRRMRFLRYHVGKIAVTSANATRRGASVFTRTDKRLCSLRLKFEALQFWHVGAVRTKADREAQAEARRRLLQTLFPSDSAGVREPDD